MSAYWLGRANVIDPELYKQYVPLNREAMAPYKPEALVRAGRFQVLEGSTSFDRFVVLRFESMEAAIECYHSPVYVEATKIRRAASGACDLVIVEGLPPLV